MKRDYKFVLLILSALMQWLSGAQLANAERRFTPIPAVILPDAPHIPAATA